MRLHDVKLLSLLSLVILVGCGEVSESDGDDDNGNPPPQITSFTATPSSISEVGQPVTLSWITSGTETSLTLQPTSAGTTTVTDYDSYIVYPTENTTYTLTASNSAGSVFSSVAVTSSDSATPPPSDPPPSDPPPSDPPPTDPPPSDPPPTDPPPSDPPPTDPPPTDPPPSDPPPSDPPEESEGNRDKVEQLLGDWTITYSIGSEKFTDNFGFDELLELLPGDFVAVGPGEAQAGYEIGDEFIEAGYYIYDPPSPRYSQHYYFDFTSSDAISGYTYIYDTYLEDGGGDYSFIGTRTR